MKTLKLEHHLADLVRQGKKTSTWRLYDDKDLSVNDTVNLLDKADPKRPETWRQFAIARIDNIIQKRLGDIQDTDHDGHERFESHKAMLETYRTYYGPQVDDSTVVKIIHFTLLPQNEESSNDVANATTDMKDIKLYADGGSRGNPGPSSSGFVIIDAGGKVLVKKGVYLGVTTNNQAEYQALKFGLEEVLRMGITDIDVYMDSLLVINQMRGIFKIRNRDLWPIHNAIKHMVTQFHHISFTHVPRELNKLADQAVNEALDEALKV
ncbi:MAG TPA: reverse transcriptase-like protein [Candidatus Saccharimonadales bacterium]|nr:reverse transcriptase-like protein [Candidatus Saccharimonadales bacterium]